MRNFAIYRLPHQKVCTIVAGTSHLLSSYAELGGESGFVIAPFLIGNDRPLITISPDVVRIFDDVKDVDCEIKKKIDECCKLNATADNGRSSDRGIYTEDFNLFHEQLANGEFSKIVLARCCTAETCNSPSEMFAEACCRYPRLFIALFSTPESGTWIMATPEVLLEKNGERWKSMALAGTMRLSGDSLLFDVPIGSNGEHTIMWSEKNIQEQRYVATYINEKIRSFADDIKEDGPRTVRAGNLVHLRSDFSFTIQNNNIGRLIETLHPTPAVCGLPKEKAQKFIIDNEHCERKYYSGFTGPIGINGETHLYVSLRCMEISNDKCHLYAGGGLLRDSTEQSEWEETEAKMMTMKEICSATKKI